MESFGRSSLGVMFVSGDGGTDEDVGGAEVLGLEGRFVDDREDSEAASETEVARNEAALDSVGDFSGTTRADGVLGVGNCRSRHGPAT